MIGGIVVDGIVNSVHQPVPRIASAVYVGSIMEPILSNKQVFGKDCNCSMTTLPASLTMATKTIPSSHGAEKQLHVFDSAAIV